MNSINIEIEEGNVSINQKCTNDDFMLATSVMFSSMVQNSSNTLDELLEILKQNTMNVIESNSLIKNEEEIKDDI